MSLHVVFSGPSLTARDRATFSEICFRPPAAQGDILRAIADAPCAIGLIDGFFGDRLAVHQKEILDAMAAGIAVFGAASMGALRAAELAPFGMVGIGEVFQAYANGRLDSDAEVAVAHAPEELDFAPTSISLVDVRETVASLGRRRLATDREQDRILQAAMDIHFTERSWRRLAQTVHTNPGEAKSLTELLTGAHVQRKRLDAVCLLRSLGTKPVPPNPSLQPAPKTRDYQRILSRVVQKD